MRAVARRRLLWIALALVAASAAAGLAHAHTRSASYSSWEIADDGARVRLRISLLELTRLPPELFEPGGDPIGRYLSDRLSLLRGDERCEPEPAERLRAPEGWALYEWHVACAGPGPLAIESEILLEVAPSHLHFARLRGEPSAVLERVLTRAEPRWVLGEGGDESGRGDAAGTTLVGYVGLGIEHILSGWDHMAFVLALLLLASRLGEVAGLVTAFTIAHSITLGLAVLGVVHPEGQAVEALIGYSIALVALENGWLASGRGPLLPVAASAGLLGLLALSLLGVGGVPPLVLTGVTLFTVCHFGLLRRAERPARLRAAVAFGFGLVHGFGFAGVLAEMQLPTDRLAPALFGFNAGVEIGQLGAVIVIWPLLRALARWQRGRAYDPVIEAGSAAICGLGLFWFLTRTFG